MSTTDADDESAAPGPTLAEVTAAARSLAEIMTAHGLVELTLALGGLDLRLRAAGQEPAASVVPVVQKDAESTARPAPEVVTGHVIIAPMIGTFYAAPTPGVAPYVSVGDRIEVGQTVGIIEAMKIMNEIPSDRAGVVAEILVANGQAVEYGSPLMRIDPEDGRSS